MGWRKLTREQRKDTEPWIRNKADELAVDNGCWFAPVRAAYMIWWVERYCRLYEGEGFAGNPCIMPSVADQPAEWNEIPQLFPDFYDDEGQPLETVMEFYLDRIAWHNELYSSGTFMHWQFECHARIYGWVREADERWKAVPIPEREANVLPETGTIVPGRYPTQTGFAAFRANEYESLYVRTYIIAAEDYDQLIDTLLSFDGFQEEMISFLIKTGQNELNERAAQNGCVKHTEIDHEQSS